MQTFIYQGHVYTITKRAASSYRALRAAVQAKRLTDEEARCAVLREDGQDVDDPIV
jgi:hypothetical protein